MQKAMSDDGQRNGTDVGSWSGRIVCPLLLIGLLVFLVPLAHAGHQRHGAHADGDTHEPTGPAYPIPGASFS